MQTHKRRLWIRVKQAEGERNSGLLPMTPPTNSGSRLFSWFDIVMAAPDIQPVACTSTLTGGTSSVQ
jgi:hypothetical protein